MSTAILVAYVTRYGSTQDVAEAIALELRKHGLDVDVQPAHDVQSLEKYGAVILGAPIYMFHWHKDAHRFLKRYHAALMARTITIFALGPLHTDEKEFREAYKQLEKDLTSYPWLKTDTVKIFGGKLDPAKLGFPYKLLPALRKMPASDIRDWEAIRDWASTLATKLPQAPLEVKR